jgi:hypothetical protein
MANEDYVYNMSENQGSKTACTSFTEHLNSTEASISTNDNYLFNADPHINTSNFNNNKKSFFYGDNLLANSKNQYEKNLSKSYFDALPPDYEISIINASETLAETSIFEADYTIQTNSTLSEIAKNLNKMSDSFSVDYNKSKKMIDDNL